VAIFHFLTKNTFMPVLDIRNLTKKYGSLTAVNDLSLQVNRGNVFGILGPNGSGKTTTLGIILGIIKANRGSYTWFDGQYGQDERLHLGALLETPNFYPYMSAAQNLEIVAHIKKIKAPRIDETLELVNLAGRKHSRFRTFSFGMKQRLAIAAAMIGNPEVLLFDEPTNGLDPQGIAEVRDVVQRIAGEGKSIIMASHILDEVEKVCSHVCIIKNGRMLATGEVGAILSSDRQLDIGAADLTRLREILAKAGGVRKIEEKNRHLTLYVKEGTNPAALNELAYRQGIVLTHLALRPKSLEAEFLEITSSGKDN
jgi:ABC-2 type transport system ATP-binding protein